MTSPELPGLDLVRLHQWLAEAEPQFAADLSAPLSGTLVAGGKSNLTFDLTDGRQSWILRRPPVGKLLATAHDMTREFRVMKALRGTAVPVPETVCLCTDEGVLGAPFYLMKHVKGTPYRLAQELAPLGAEKVRLISTGLIDTLADLHDVDPREVGLADFGNPQGFLQRQLRRWRTQLDASSVRELPSAASLHSALESQLETSRWPAAEPRIVHGDFRLDNLLIDQAGRPAALIDWELATLGDCLCDLAQLVIYGRFDSLVDGPAIMDVASAPGYLSEQALLERYALRSGRDLSRFGTYLGLAAYKVAAIAQGVHHRFVHGQTVGPGFENVGNRVVPILDAGHALMKEYS